MNDTELNTLLNSLSTPPCDDGLADRIIAKSSTLSQEKSFFANVLDAIHSKYFKYSFFPVAACVSIALFIYTPSNNDIDMLEYAEIFLVENMYE